MGQAFSLWGRLSACGADLSLRRASSPPSRRAKARRRLKRAPLGTLSTLTSTCVHLPLAQGGVTNLTVPLTGNLGTIQLSGFVHTVTEITQPSDPCRFHANLAGVTGVLTSTSVALRAMLSRG